MFFQSFDTSRWFGTKKGILCHKCGKLLVSFYSGDVKKCSCDNQTTVSGGFTKLNVAGNDPNMVQVIDVDLSKCYLTTVI